MDARHFLLLALIPLATACGEAAEKSIDDSFAARFRDTCLSTATNGGVPAAIASTVCECGIDRINQKYPAMEKVRLSQEDIVPIMAECAQIEMQKKTNG